MAFDERLKKYREQKGLTQDQLAKRSGISCRMIQNYESGLYRPRLGAAEKLASALEIPVSDLLGESGTLVAQATEKYGSRGAKQAEELMSEVTGLFAGGDLRPSCATGCILCILICKTACQGCSKRRGTC